MKNLIKTFVCMAMAVIFICPVSRQGDRRTEKVAPSDAQIIKDIRSEGVPIIGVEDTAVNCTGTYQYLEPNTDHEELNQNPIVISNESAMLMTEDELIAEHPIEEKEQVSTTPIQQTSESDYIYTEPVIIEQEEQYEPPADEAAAEEESEPEEVQAEVVDESEEIEDAVNDDSYEEPEESSVSTVSYSDDDLYVLAHVICGEAMECSWDMQAAVGSVVLNRVNHYAFPNSIYGVVFDYGQYACTWDGNYYRTPTDTNWEVARYLLENGGIFPSYVIFQADRVIGNSYYTTIGNMVFSYNSWDAN